MISCLHPSLALAGFCFCTCYACFLEPHCTISSRTGCCMSVRRSLCLRPPKLLKLLLPVYETILAHGSLALAVILPRKPSRDSTILMRSAATKRCTIIVIVRSCAYLVLSSPQLHVHRPQLQPQLGPRLDLYTQSSVSSHRAIDPVGDALKTLII
jgi:hypothetical protein